MVTGGSRGIGAACARLGGRRGYAVCVNYAGNQAAADAVVADITAGGGTAIAVQGDMAVAADIDRLFETCDHRLGPVTDLVNNAGITGPGGRFLDAAVADIRAVIDLNVTGAILVSQAAARRMARSRGGGGGAQVIVSSKAAILGGGGTYVHYGASKGAMDTLVVGLATELAAEGIRVNGVRPGIIDTDIHAAGGMPDRAARMRGQVPMGRAGTAADVAEGILWLLSGAAGYCTGANLDIAGGR